MFSIYKLETNIFNRRRCSTVCVICSSRFWETVNLIHQV